MSEGQGEGSRRPATERADELLNRAGWTVGLFASMIGVRLTRIAAFAREEAEDMWAEAQSMRQQSGGGLSAAVGQVADTVRSKAEETKENLEQSVAPDRETKTGTATAEAEERGAEQNPEADGEADIKATEAARRRAQELGVDLREVEGTGSGSQITVQDVKKKAEAGS